MSDFWKEIDRQLDELKTATSAADVTRILSRERCPDPHVMACDNAAAFFAGGGGDDTVYEALREAGWKVVWYDAWYYNCLRAPNGDKITYVEGDVYVGDTKAKT